MVEVCIRTLRREELPEIWKIDRAELVERVYYLEDGELALRDERYDMPGWPEGEPEHYHPSPVDCYERGGTFLGAFDGQDRLVGAVVLESRFIGTRRDRLQLKFLHVGRTHRGRGLGTRLFSMAADAARDLGARWLYVSATPSENTVGFYLQRGCTLAREIDPELLELESEDIHLERPLLPSAGGSERRTA